MKNKIDVNIINQVTMLLQIILGIFALSFGIMGMFERELFFVAEVLVGILMFVLAYNNQKVYKRRFMTVVYNVLGIIILASILFG